MEIKLFIVLIFIILGLTGCAKNYNRINPTQMQNAAKFEDDNFIINYEYDVLATNENIKYSKKALLNNLKVVSVSVTNKTDKTISIKDDAQFLVNGNAISVISPSILANQINQNTAGFLFYGLLTPSQLYKKSRNGSVEWVFPIGLILAPALVAVNMITSSTANSKMKAELTKWDIMKMYVSPGETISGIIAFEGVGFKPLSIKLID